MKNIHFKHLDLQKQHLLSILLAGLILFILIPVDAVAQNGVTPEHIAKMETVTSTAISDDGRFIAYTKSIPTDPYKENAANSTHLYVLDVEESISKTYYSASSVASVQFRPGTYTITFLTQRSGDDTRSLYEVPLDGGERAASRLDYTYRMLQWFDTYLMTGDSSAEIPHWDPPIPPGD